MSPLLCCHNLICHVTLPYRHHPSYTVTLLSRHPSRDVTPSLGVPLSCHTPSLGDMYAILYTCHCQSLVSHEDTDVTVTTSVCPNQYQSPATCHTTVICHQLLPPMHYQAQFLSPISALYDTCWSLTHTVKSCHCHPLIQSMTPAVSSTHCHHNLSVKSISSYVN